MAFLSLSLTHTRATRRSLCSQGHFLACCLLNSPLWLSHRPCKQHVLIWREVQLRQERGSVPGHSGHWCQGRTRTQSLFSIFALPSPPPAWLLGDATVQICLHPHPIKVRVSYYGRQKIVVRNIKRNLPLGGVSEKGWQPSLGLGLACDKWGIPRLREGRGVCSQLAKWGFCVVGFHGTCWGALTESSSLPDSLAPFCHSPLLSPHRDRGEREGITSPRFCLSPRCSAVVLSSLDGASRPFPASLSPTSFRVSVSQCSH